MAVQSDYITGTISLTNGEVAFTGTSTGWELAGFREGDTIIDITGATEYMGVIATIDANGAGTLTKPWEGPTLEDVGYRMRYQPDGSRVTAQARSLIELLGNGNLQALAGLSGSANQVAMFTGPGAMTLVPKTDLISGAAYNVQVDDLTARAAYDGQDEGFAVLVADTGDGRSAIYSKASPTSGDWSDPAYVTGPFADVTVGTVTELDYGDTPTITGTSGPGTLELDFGLPGGPALSVGTVTRGDADVTSTLVAGGYELDFTIPSQVAQGDYSGATAYVTGDIVQDQGSSWVALQATTGNAPPTLPTTSNTYWQLLARAGNDGAGTVTSLAGGTGIDIDSTDPTVPVVSAVIASQAEAEAGTVANKLMTPERTAQAIAELSPEVPADLYRPSNILGTVSQSGGVPTGAIIESGSNANGQYEKLADGSMECTHKLVLPMATASYFRGEWTFPATFSAPPKVFGTVTTHNGGYSPSDRSAYGIVWTEDEWILETKVQYLDVLRSWGAPNIAAGNTVTVNVSAKGRWF